MIRYTVRFSVGLVRGRCVGWFVKFPVLLRFLPSLPRSLFLLPPSLACYRGLHTVALCKSAPLSRRHVPVESQLEKTQSSPHLRWAQLWRFIKSDLIFLVVAVAVSHVHYQCVYMCMCCRIIKQIISHLSVLVCRFFYLSLTCHSFSLGRERFIFCLVPP